MRPPLMGEAACFVRKMFVFGVVEKCKLLLGRGLKKFGFLCNSRIVQTESMSMAWSVQGGVPRGNAKS